jgi:hypothetical protein
LGPVLTAYCWALAADWAPAAKLRLDCWSIKEGAFRKWA